MVSLQKISKNTPIVGHNLTIGGALFLYKFTRDDRLAETREQVFLPSGKRNSLLLPSKKHKKLSYFKKPSPFLRNSSFFPYKELKNSYLYSIIVLQKNVHDVFMSFLCLAKGRGEFPFF